MTDNGKIFWGGVTILGGIFVYQHWIKPGILIPVETAKQVQRMRITNASVGLDLKKKQLSINFNINNPNNEPMTIRSIVGDVLVSQSQPNKPALHIGNIDQFPKPAVIIPPNNAKNFTLVVGLKALTVISYLTQMMAGTWKGQVVAFNGTINANNRAWPINEKIQIA